jgi:hypothetical protein
MTDKVKAPTDEQIIDLACDLVEGNEDRGDGVAQAALFLAVVADQLGCCTNCSKSTISSIAEWAADHIEEWHHDDMEQEKQRPKPDLKLVKPTNDKPI